MAITTRVIDFATGAATDECHLILDETANTDSDGNARTSFYPGESCYLLLIMPSGWTLRTMRTSAGSLTKIGTVTRTATERVSLDEVGAGHTINYDPTGALSKTWYGRDGQIAVSGRELTGGAAPAIGDISYPYRAVQYRLTVSSSLSLEEDDEYPVLIVATVEQTS